MLASHFLKVKGLPPETIFVATSDQRQLTYLLQTQPSGQLPLHLRIGQVLPELVELQCANEKELYCSDTSYDSPYGEFTALQK